MQGDHVSNQNTLLRLPHDTLLVIMSFLNPKELCACACVNSVLNALSENDQVWTHHLEQQLVPTREPQPSSMETDNSSNLPNKERYKRFIVEWRKYLPIYVQQRRLWMKLEQWLAEKAPHIELNPGVEESSLDSFEEETDLQLPLDLRCTLRIHNGQKEAGPRRTVEAGLFGGYQFYDYTADLWMPPLSGGISMFNSLKQHRNILPGWTHDCFPIIQTKHRDCFIFIALKDIEHAPNMFHYPPYQRRTTYRIPAGSVITHSARLLAPIVLANSWTSFLQQYIQDLVDRQNFVVNPESKTIVRFPSLSGAEGYGGSDTTTNGVRIQANALFIPQRSIFEDNEASYFFAYRIRISMDASCSPNQTCVLTHRHWVIKDAHGRADRVDGPGVIGLFPRVSPGSYFEYCSCTTVESLTGTMEGSFTMQKENGETFEAIIRPFDTSIPASALMYLRR